MGFGGFNMHPRQGLVTKYLSDEFMDCVKACIEKAESENMEAWFYELIVKAPFGENISVENYFLTGNFGVSVMGDDARLTSPKAALYYSDVTAQGLPFYGGAIEYEIPFECEKGAIEAGAEIYAGVTASASLDGKEIGKLAFTPYKTERVSVDAGKHVLKIKVFLSRVNSFGALHACTRKRYFGVDSRMTEGSDYSREYILRPSGLFKAPYVNFIKE